MSFHNRLLCWYQKEGRHDLPWRCTGSPYEIYVSEVMLQQTQLSTVLDRFYHPFLRRFPTLSALARADETEVLKSWQGLGYYQRALNMHQAAKHCGNQLPTTVEGLLALPGIGRNTAHAIAAFAYKHPVAVMEANVKRLLYRIYAMKHASESELWQRAAALLNAEDPFHHNQAMMDLGALLCTPKDPKCGSCPASGICMGKKNPHAYPERKKKKPPPIRREQIIIRRNMAGRYYAVPRTGRFLKGLYYFPKQQVKKTTRLGSIEQKYSHFTLLADIYLSLSRQTGAQWYSLNELRALPMSKAEQKILCMLEENE